MLFRNFGPLAPFRVPFTDIQPFNHQDGLTFQRALEQIRKKLNELIGEFNSSQMELFTEVIKRIDDLTAAVDAKLSQTVNKVDEKIDDLVLLVDGKIVSMEEYVDAAVNSIINSTIDVSDPVVFAILKGDTQSRAEVQNLIDDMVKGPSSTRDFLEKEYAYRPHREADSTFSVVDFGAVKSSTVSSTAAIQAAIDAAEKVGGTVIFPSGDYASESTLIVGNGVKIDGRGSTLHRTGGGAMLVNYKAGDRTTKAHDGNSNIRVSNLTLDAHGESVLNNANVVTFDHCQNIEIVNVKILRTRGFHALELNAVKNYRVSNSKFLGFVPIAELVGKEAVQIDVALEGSIASGAYDGTACHNGIFDNCEVGPYLTLGAHERGIGSHTNSGVYTDITIRNSRFDGCAIAITPFHWQGVLIDGVTIVGNTDNGIWARFTSDMVVNTPVIRNGANARGLSLSTGCRDYSVINPSIVGGREGIYLAGDYGQLVGGRVRGATGFGVVMEGESHSAHGFSALGVGTAGAVASAFRVSGASKNAYIGNCSARPHGIPGVKEVEYGISVATSTSGGYGSGNDFTGIAKPVSGINQFRNTGMKTASSGGQETVWRATVKAAHNAANPVSTRVPFPEGLFNGTPSVTITPVSGTPSNIRGITAGNIDNTGLTIYLDANWTGESNVNVIAVGN